MWRRAGRWWLENPGATFVVGLGVLVAGVAIGEPPLTAAAGVSLVASLVQGMRWLWNSGLRVRALLLGVLLPAMLTTLALSGAPPDLGMALFWAPTAAAVATEALVRHVRRRRGLPAVSPQDAAPRMRRASVRGCLLTGLVLLAATGGCFVLALNASVRHATAFKGRLHAGMTVAEVYAAADTGRHLVFVYSTPGAPEVSIGESSASVGGERAEGREAARALLERHAADLKLESVSFMYLSLVPVRSSVRVRFSPAGRVTAIEGPFTHAD
jgi:hypothetical protein